jgi:hypothetical protein
MAAVFPILECSHNLVKTNEWKCLPFDYVDENSTPRKSSGRPTPAYVSQFDKHH